MNIIIITGNLLVLAKLVIYISKDQAETVSM